MVDPHLTGATPPPGRPGDDETTRLQATHYGRRAVTARIIAVVLWVFTIGGVLGLEVPALNLLHHGLRTTGTVISITPGYRSSRATVQYDVDGVTYSGDVIDLGYSVGDPVTVIYSASDPSNIRTPETSPADSLTIALIGVMLLPLSVASWWAARTWRYAVRVRRCLRGARSWDCWQYRVAAPGWLSGGLLIRRGERDPWQPAVVVNLGVTGEMPAGRSELYLAGDPTRFAVVWNAKGWRPVVLHSPGLRRRARMAELAQAANRSPTSA